MHEVSNLAKDNISPTDHQKTVTIINNLAIDEENEDHYIAHSPVFTNANIANSVRYSVLIFITKLKI